MHILVESLNNVGVTKHVFDFRLLSQPIRKCFDVIQIFGVTDSTGIGSAQRKFCQVYAA